MDAAFLTNCPNCGAPAHGRECTYCGTPLKEPSLDLAIGRTVHAVFEAYGHSFEFDFVLEAVEMANEFETTDFYADAGVYYTLRTPTYKVRLDGTVVPKDFHGKDVMVVRRDL